MGPSASPTDPLKPAWPVPLPEQDYVPIDRWNTDGLIVVAPLHSQARSEYVQELIALGHPILLIGSGESGPTIVADNSGGILEAMRHLVSHGHRKIAFIAGSQDDLRGDSGERLRAYQNFCQSHNLENDPRLVAYSQHIYSGGYLAMQQILASGAEFTAVMASNDESALGAMEALSAAGLKVPQDVAVIGFDNRLEGAVQEPGADQRPCSAIRYWVSGGGTVAPEHRRKCPAGANGQGGNLACCPPVVWLRKKQKNIGRAWRAGKYPQPGKPG
jgi:hypothetical protein